MCEVISQSPQSFTLKLDRKLLERLVKLAPGASCAAAVVSGDAVGKALRHVIDEQEEARDFRDRLLTVAPSLQVTDSSSSSTKDCFEQNLLAAAEMYEKAAQERVQAAEAAAAHAASWQEPPEGERLSAYDRDLDRRKVPEIHGGPEGAYARDATGKWRSKSCCAMTRGGSSETGDGEPRQVVRAASGSEEKMPVADVIASMEAAYGQKGGDRRRRSSRTDSRTDSRTPSSRQPISQARPAAPATFAEMMEEERRKAAAAGRRKAALDAMLGDLPQMPQGLQSKPAKDVPSRTGAAGGA